MSGADWTPPQRDEEYAQVRQHCLERDLVLQSARKYGEALRWGADYRIVDKHTRSTVYEADSLDALRRWLRLEVPA